MDKSSLKQHKFDKGKFTTPLNEITCIHLNSWSHERFPEFLWIALIFENYPRTEALKKCALLVNKLHEIKKDIILPRISTINELEIEKQNLFFEYALTIIKKEVWNSLTVIFNYNKFPRLNCYFNCCTDIDERLKLIIKIIEKTENHQSFLSTDIRFILVYCAANSGHLFIKEDLILVDALKNYPFLEHNAEIMSMYRSMIRSMEGGLHVGEKDNKEFIKDFWTKLSNLCECSLYVFKYEKNNDGAEDFYNRAKSIIIYYSELLINANPLDEKMSILVSIATYSLKRINELITHDLYNEISGRSITRIIIENYIIMKYLLKEESSHKNIWRDYKLYGLGQYKLIVKRAEQNKYSSEVSHVKLDLMGYFINEFLDEEFLNMDTKYFDKKSIREKAILVDEKELFDYYYDYDSAFEHGLWGAIRESSLLKCATPGHEYHCTPDVDDSQKLESVWIDCKKVMIMTIDLLESIYSLPSKYKIVD